MGFISAEGLVGPKEGGGVLQTWAKRRRFGATSGRVVWRPTGNEWSRCQVARCAHRRLVVWGCSRCIIMLGSFSSYLEIEVEKADRCRWWFWSEGSQGEGGGNQLGVLTESEQGRVGHIFCLYLCLGVDVWYLCFGRPNCEGAGRPLVVICCKIWACSMSQVWNWALRAGYLDPRKPPSVLGHL